MQSKSIQSALAENISLFSKPTPLEKLNNLSDETGPEIYIKRDDLTSIGAGGNKARKLEYIISEAQTCDADTLVTIGSFQSNHVRMTAAAAKKVGLDIHGILIVDEPTNEHPTEGNRILEEIADMHVSYTTSEEASRKIDQVMDKIENAGKEPYFIQGGGHTVAGSVGYLNCVAELAEQIDLSEVDYIVTPTGTGTTQAGVAAGLQNLNYDTEVVGISIARNANRCLDEIQWTIEELEQGIDGLCLDDQNISVFDRYIGEDGYGCLTDETAESIKLMAQQEGLFLDPVYTGKAFSGLLDLIDRGYISKDDTVIFLHTGGLPGLFVSRFSKQSIWE